MKRRIAALLIAGVITASGCQGGFALAAETETENQAETGTEESTEDTEEAENSLSEEERAESLAGYADPSKFSAAFQSVMQRTPSAYRRGNVNL